MPYSLHMHGNSNDRLLSTSECIKRTGLSHKALRLYERYRLVEPKRSPKGWRGYGTEELLRLNTIGILKAMSLSLRQIRSLLGSAPPSLEEILRVQLEALAQRRNEAERAERAAQRALQWLAEDGSLDVDRLCELLRDTSMSSIPTAIQALLDRHMDLRQQQRWHTASSSEPDALQHMKDYAKAQRAEVIAPLQLLLEAGATPQCVEVQRLVAHNNRLMNQFRVREHLLAAHERDPGTFGKALNVGRDAVRVAKQNPSSPERLIPDVNVLSFFFRAIRESEPYMQTTSLLRALESEGAASDTAHRAREIAMEFRTLCVKHALGDPLIYARWAPTQYAGIADALASHAREWSLLCQALQDLGNERG